MRVVKVLNNSLVLALDEAGQETILMGKGIGYHKSIGYQFQESEIEKVFVLKDKEVSRSIIRLAAETDAVYFELAKSVIDLKPGDRIVITGGVTGASGNTNLIKVEQY